jgi:F-type H+-transporting ATPase subunit b
MFPALMFLAVADAGNSSSWLAKILAPVTTILSEFGIDWPLFLAQVLCFAIVAVILWRFAFKPVLATMEERQRQIESGLKYAEATKAELAHTQQASAALIKQAQLEGSRLIDEARKTAKDFLDQQQKDAAARAGDMIAKAQQAIDSEHKKMLEQARQEVARLVVQTTRQVLAKELSEEERARYNAAASRALSVE